MSTISEAMKQVDKNKLIIASRQQPDKRRKRDSGKAGVASWNRNTEPKLGFAKTCAKMRSIIDYFIAHRRKLHFFLNPSVKQILKRVFPEQQIENAAIQKEFYFNCSRSNKQCKKK